MDFKKRRKKDKKSKKAKKSHKHHRKKDEPIIDKNEYKSDKSNKNKNNYNDPRNEQLSPKISDFRDKSRHYHNEKYDRYQKASRYDKDVHGHSNYTSSDSVYIRTKDYEKDKRRQQKSEELLENRRKNRPMSPPKEIHHSTHRKYTSNDPQHWRSAHYIPSESSRHSYETSRVAPPPPEDWNRRAHNGFKERPRNISPGYHDHR